MWTEFRSVSAAGRAIIFLVRSSTTKSKVTPLRTSGLLQSPLEHDKWFISVSPSPLIPVVGVRGTMERTRVQRCSESHFCDTHVPVQTRGYGYVWALGLSGESARWLPAVAGRAPIRRFVQQPLPFSTSTRFVNTVSWLSFLNTRLYAGAPWNIVQTETRTDLDLSTRILEFVPIENNFIVKYIYIYKRRLCVFIYATSSMEWKG